MTETWTLPFFPVPFRSAGKLFVIRTPAEKSIHIPQIVISVMSVPVSKICPTYIRSATLYSS